MPVLRDILGLSQTEIDKLAAAGIYRNQGRTSQSPQGARGNWLIDIAFITHGVVADPMTISPGNPASFGGGMTDRDQP